LGPPASDPDVHRELAGASGGPNGGTAPAFSACRARETRERVLSDPVLRCRRAHVRGIIRSLEPSAELAFRRPPPRCVLKLVLN
jgi:hypothetical protein